MQQTYLHLRGCRQHNLKNISLDLPKNSIVALVGVSGSGKSSLAFDTLFAEGQRRYLEYLSPEARSLIKQMPKPTVDLIEGLSPALAIGHGRHSFYGSGTIATYTDTYDFLTLLFARIGEQHSPTTGKKLTRHTRQEIIDLILKEYPPATRIQLFAPIKLGKENPHDIIQRLLKMGFIRLTLNGQNWTQEDLLPSNEMIKQIEVVIDRLEMKEDVRERLSSSVETAMELSQGILKVQEGKNGPFRSFTEVFVCPDTDYSFAPLEVSDFNFNSPRGACPICLGLGSKAIVDEASIIWDPQLSLSEQVNQWLEALPRKMSHFLQSTWNAFLEKKGVHENTFVDEISKKLLNEVLWGSDEELIILTQVEKEEKSILIHWKGIVTSFEKALKDKKIRIESFPFVKWQTCSACKGGRLKPESLSCLIEGMNIHQLCQKTVSNLTALIQSWHLTGKRSQIAHEILPPILSRLNFLEQVGLGYLELNRTGNTLSDGEIQRIQLASQINVKLSGILYILDEPSLGLHRKDIQHLERVIQELKNLNNTVILVEHEPALIKQAHTIVELGPGAGIHGGYLVFQGTYSDLLKNKKSLTGNWLSERLQMPPPPKRKIGKNKLKVTNATLHNLINFSVNVPLGCLTAFCGVSGSGKSTLVQEIIGKEVQKELRAPSSSKLIQGIAPIKRLVLSHKQNESFSTRSIPATFVDIMNPLRNLFAETKLAKARGYTPARFSLNKKGGRCEACEGLGYQRIRMQFMPDMFIPCEVCRGLRYNYETLQITWENRNIAEVLSLSVEEAHKLFKYIPAIGYKLEFMNELGLEYLTLGQPFNTLSSGEIQRLRLVADLATKSLETTLYILDEPSAGLHFQDIEKLVKILHRLVEKGHSVFVVEHHLSLLRQADWLIELGPGGGPDGGHLLFEGPPDKMIQANTPTGRFFKP